MFTPNIHIQEENYANLTDYSVRRSKEARAFYTFVTFEDDSYVLLSNIFAPSRAAAFAIVLDRFADCNDFIKHINLYEAD